MVFSSFEVLKTWSYIIRLLEFFLGKKKRWKYFNIYFCCCHCNSGRHEWEYSGRRRTKGWSCCFYGRAPKREYPKAEHPKSEKRLSNLSNSIVISKMLQSRGVLFATVNLPKARLYAPTFFINYLNTANE